MNKFTNSKTIMRKRFTKYFINVFHLYSLQPDTSRLARYIKPLADQMVSLREREELQQFVANRTKIFEKSTQSIKQSLETIEINSQWQTKNYNSIGRYLTQYSIIPTTK